MSSATIYLNGELHQGVVGEFSVFICVITLDEWRVDTEYVTEDVSVEWSPDRDLAFFDEYSLEKLLQVIREFDLEPMFRKGLRFPAEMSLEEALKACEGARRIIMKVDNLTQIYAEVIENEPDVDWDAVEIVIAPIAA